VRIVALSPRTWARKAIVRPSGDHAGSLGRTRPVAKRRIRPPEAGTIASRPPATTARRRPSGDQLSRRAARSPGTAQRSSLRAAILHRSTARRRRTAVSSRRRRMRCAVPKASRRSCSPARRGRAQSGGIGHPAGRCRYRRFRSWKQSLEHRGTRSSRRSRQDERLRSFSNDRFEGRSHAPPTGSAPTCGCSQRRLALVPAPTARHSGRRSASPRARRGPLPVS
jgi:hypothetical protein